MKATMRDRHGRFTSSEVEEILSKANRSECREKIKRAVTTDDLIEHWLEKHVVRPCAQSRKEVASVCGVDSVGIV